MNGLKILVIEDEASLVAMIQRGLTLEGYQVSVALDGSTGLQLACRYEYDLIIIDLMILGTGGWEICRTFRESNRDVPILMLTESNTPEPNVNRPDAEANDYLVKPFNFKVLQARIHTLTRRNKSVATVSHIIKIADLHIDTTAKTVSRSNRKIELTTTEFRLLEFLATNRQRVLSHLDILEHVWDINFNLGTNVVDMYINYLRKKLDKDFEPKLIHTAFDMGYVLKEA
jgi:DNA-binding response OmpR family regulator